MYVDARRATWLVATTFGVLAASGCTEDPQHTSLRPEGPPEVLAVLVGNDPGAYGEVATFCKLGDAKRPGEVGLIDLSTVQICDPDLSVGATPVTDADPLSWRVRIMFDELLDPSIEELIPLHDDQGMLTGTFRGSIANTHPVELVCGGVDVPYDGYYTPSGNALTWPLGPALVITPDDPTSVAGGTDCTVTINSVVTDKDGNEVPTAGDPLGDQRGPYTFTIANIALVATSPEGIVDPSTRPTIAPESPLTFSFNAIVDPASFTTADIRVFSGVDPDCTGGTLVMNNKVTLFQGLDDVGDIADVQSIELADASATNANPAPDDPTSLGNMFEPETTYRVDFVLAAKVSDIAGGEGVLVPLKNADGDSLSLCFDTDVAM